MGVGDGIIIRGVSIIGDGDRGAGITEADNGGTGVRFIEEEAEGVRSFDGDFIAAIFNDIRVFGDSINIR